MTGTTLAAFSESTQMYLVTITRLRVDGQPVPLSRLAEVLSISPVSVNEMCRKLQDHGLVIYRPYKGALLTPEGERRAYYILRRHRLWEVFLVEKLGFDYDQAHDAACHLEHSTLDLVANRLDAFLGYPAVNPQGEPIPRADGVLPKRSLFPLATLSAGQRGHVAHCDVDDATLAFLDERGVRPGATLAVAATAEDSLLVQVEGTHIALARSLAEMVRVEREEIRGKIARDTPLRSRSLSDKENSKTQSRTETVANQIPLHKLRVGQRGIVVRVGGKGPVRRRMMDMGLVSGAEVKVVRVAPLGDPVEFEVKGYRLSLRKSEARNIIVEAPAEEGK